MSRALCQIVVLPNPSTAAASAADPYWFDGMDDGDWGVIQEGDFEPD